MNRKFLSIAVAVSLITVACQQNQAGKEQNIKPSPAIVSTDTAKDAIVKASVTAKDGSKMEMIFNNTKATVSVLLNGETIEMKQDTMASGIKYSNAHYQLTEWHGEGELTKDGKTVFKYKN